MITSQTFHTCLCSITLPNSWIHQLDTSVASMEELPWRIPEGGRPMSYQPLAEPPATIRLFRIVSCGDCSVAGRLQNFEFSEIPEYRALSYMWGLKDKQHPICIDGHSFMVYSNLFTFLQLYKTRRVDEWIWIDQVRLPSNQISCPANPEADLHRPKQYGRAQCTSQAHERDLLECIRSANMAQPRPGPDISSWRQMLSQRQPIPQP